MSLQNGNLQDLRQFVEVAEIGQNTIDKALIAVWKDFEDSVQALVAEKEKVDYIITRNEKDFLLSKIKAVSPKAFLESFL
jgi:hypothetical protein